MVISLKKLLAVVVTVAGILAVSSPVYAYTSVRGYYRSNGTYVQPYVRSSPNALKYDNYGYTGGSRYNNSYYGSGRSYSSNWYQPSYTTDPSYYTGKSLYNSRSRNYR